MTPRETVNAVFATPNAVVAIDKCRGKQTKIVRDIVHESVQQNRHVLVYVVNGTVYVKRAKSKRSATNLVNYHLITEGLK